MGGFHWPNCHTQWYQASGAALADAEPGLQWLHLGLHQALAGSLASMVVPAPCLPMALFLLPKGP